MVAYSEESVDEIVQPDDIWMLDIHSSRFSGNGQVLYQMPQDALHTFRGREYGDWNQFSFIDSRRLVRLKKGYRVKLIEPFFNGDIYKVNLLDGFSKDKTYYIITDDLNRKYKKMEQVNDKK
jgi:hypothetical protein